MSEPNSGKPGASSNRPSINGNCSAASSATGANESKNQHDPMFDEVLDQTLRAIVDDKSIQGVIGMIRGITPGASGDISADDLERIIGRILKERFPQRTLPSELARRIAETLLDDPISAERLRSFTRSAKG
jgi:hypothetical protein